MTVLADNTCDTSDNSFNTSDNYSEEKKIKVFAKQMLKNSLFIATFQEKRYVEVLGSYKDIIKIANEEQDFIENLLAVKKRLSNFYIEKKWLGITEPQTIGAPAGYNLWVNLKEEIFGSYWFKVKTVHFKDNEICLSLEIVRPYNITERSFADNISAVNDPSDFSFMEKIYQILLNLKTITNKKLYEILTISNITKTITFISLLIIATMTGLVQIIKYLMEYIITFMNSFSKLVTAFTPIVIALFNTILKIIGGLFVLIAMLFSSKTNNKSSRSYNIYPQIMPSDYNQTMAFNELLFRNNYATARHLRQLKRLKSPSSIKITPLD